MSELVNAPPAPYANTQHQHQQQHQHQYDPQLVPSHPHPDTNSGYIQHGSTHPSYNPVLQAHQGEHNPPLVSAQNQSFDMQPPPETTFDSFANLHAFAQSHAAAHGYALSINTTAKNRARVKLACVCYGAPKNTHKLTDETRVRKNRASAKTGCKMWVEGKKMEDGTWVLRVGEPNHNHSGRSVEEWSVHRRRTWGMGGTGGGIVAGAIPAGRTGVGGNGPVGEVVWRIVETEMNRGASECGVNGDTGARDRGVGRTVKVLTDKLPGIRIFKRDIYNIRAQIKKARKEAELRVANGDTSMLDIGVDSQAFGDLEAQLDPQLVEHANNAMRAQRAAARAHQMQGPPAHQTPQMPQLQLQTTPAPPPPDRAASMHSTPIHTTPIHNRQPYPEYPEPSRHQPQQSQPPPPPQHPPTPRINDRVKDDEILQLRLENQDLKEKLERYQTDATRHESDLEELHIENQTMKVELESLKLQLLRSSRRQPAASAN